MTTLDELNLVQKAIKRHRADLAILKKREKELLAEWSRTQEAMICLMA